MSDLAEAPKANKQRTIQSVEVGFRLISCLIGRTSTISLKDLSSCAGMSPSKAHLYLNSFRNIGLVAQDKRGHYKLGSYAVHLGVSAIGALDVIQEARDEMETLRDQTGEAIFVSVWSGRGACIVAKEDGLRDSPLRLAVGYFLPLLRSASGRIFLAYLPRTSVEAEIARGIAEMRASGLTIPNPDDLVAEVRAHGMARTESQLNTGFFGLSAPIFNHDGSIAAAISVVGPSGMLDTSYTGPSAAQLRAAAGRVSAKLGYYPKTEPA